MQTAWGFHVRSSLQNFSYIVLICPHQMSKLFPTQGLGWRSRCKNLAWYDTCIWQNKRCWVQNVMKIQHFGKKNIEKPLLQVSLTIAHRFPFDWNVSTFWIMQKSWEQKDLSARIGESLQPPRSQQNSTNPSSTWCFSHHLPLAQMSKLKAPWLCFSFRRRKAPDIANFLRCNDGVLVSNIGSHISQTDPRSSCNDWLHDGGSVHMKSGV